MPKEMLVVGGPNGSGKTTFIREYLARFPQPYLSADLIVEELGLDSVEHGVMTAGQEFLKRVAGQVAGEESFVVESTLSGRTFRRVMQTARRQGFEITLVFVFLDHPDSCVSRVQERVRKGGHPVPETDIRRRYPRSLANFWNIYRPLADDWCIAYNPGGEFEPVAFGSGDDFVVHNEFVFRNFTQIAQQNDA